MQLRRFVVSGSLWAGAGKVISMSASFLLTVALARALPPEAYGQYFLAVTSIIVLAGVGTIGADVSVVRMASAARARSNLSEERSVVLSCFIIVLFGAAIASGLFCLTASYAFSSLLRANDLSRLVPTLSVWLFFATLQRHTAETFRGLGSIRLATLFGGARSSGIVYSVTTSVFVLIAWALKRLTLDSAILIMTATAAMVVIIGTTKLFLNSSGPRVSSALSLGLPKLLQEGWPLWIATFATTLNFMGSAWLAGLFDSPDQVALFGAAQRFVLALIAPMVVINAVLPPLVASLHAAGDLARLQRVVRATSAMTTVPAVAMLIGLVLFGEALLATVFGEFYRDAYWPTLIICFSQAVNIATGGWQIVLPMTGMRHQLLFTSVASIAVQVTLAYMLGPELGIRGICIAFAASVVFANITGVFLVRRYLGIWTFMSTESLRMEQVRKTIAEMGARRSAPIR